MKRTSLLFLLAICCPIAGWAAGNCTVTANGVAFGAYNPLSSAAVDGNGTIQVSCTGPTDTVMGFSLSISSPAQRFMNSTDSQLLYNLYTDPGRTHVWGDGTNGTVAIPGSITLLKGHGAATSYVYGRIPGGQNTARPGSYSAQLTVTVTY